MIGPNSGSFSSPFGASGSSQGGDRTLVVSEALAEGVANRIVQQVALLDEQGDAPIKIVVSNAPGGDERAGLSVYDALRSTTAPVTILGSGRIAGAGVLAFVGAEAERRMGLPHVRFRLTSPRAPSHAGAAADLDAQAEEAEAHRQRIIEGLTAATGQSEEQIASDLSAQRAFDAEAAVEYGLIDRIIESRRAFG